VARQRHPDGPGNIPGIRNAVNSPAATSINDNGLIAVFGSHGHGAAGFTIQGSTVTRLPALPNGSVDVQPLAAGSGFMLRSATGINDSAVIVGTSSPGSAPGESFGFELTPVSS
jgi:hypothetical protein